MREHAPKKRSGEVDRQRFARYVLPAWKSRKAASITRGEINALLVPIEHGDKAHPPRPAEAMALLALIKKLYAFGLDAEVVAHHPCRTAGPSTDGAESARTRANKQPSRPARVLGDNIVKIHAGKLRGGAPLLSTTEY